MNTAVGFGWDSLRHGGLLLDPQRAAGLSSRIPPALSPSLESELRRRVSLIIDGGADVSEFAAFLLEVICGFSTESGSWRRGSQIGSEWSRSSVTGETVRPRHLWEAHDGGILPVFLDKETRLGQGRGRRVVSHVLQWLRKGEERLALLTNGRQWRLVFAGLDFDAWCEWDLDLWFEQGTPTAQVTAFRTLLQPSLWIPLERGGFSPLLQAIVDSRKGQAELSGILGERVREAVEILVRGHGEVLKQQCHDVDPADIYRAAVRMVMRLIVALFAESRDLLPREQPAYFEGYSVGGLMLELGRAAARSGGRMSRSWSAWPRLLALFRLIDSGSAHPDLLVPAYGGELFSAGSPTSQDGLSSALSVFEMACFDREAMSDREVHELLQHITRTRVKVRQGRARTSVLMPVDFSDLSSEYMGILYEGLLDFELRTAPSGDPIIFLAVGDQPALPLSRLESMDDKDLADLFEKMKNTREDEEEETSEEVVSESDEEQGEEENAEADADGEVEDDDGSRAEDSFEVVDERRAVRTRAEIWAKRAVLAAKLVRRPRGVMTPEKRRAREDAISRMAHHIVAKVILPGEWYLVRWGGTRKGAGTFYTRPGLAVPTVHRTLRPLAFVPPRDSDGKADFQAPAAAWIPKKPQDILGLKICDPACGSGTFPVAALRFLTDALYASIYYHQRLTGDIGRSLGEILGLEHGGESGEELGSERLPVRPEDPDFEIRTKALLRRYVVERSIYGVDLDPLAVELCRMSLWLETMDRSLPFSFLDHKIKCGNSLVGAWFDQFRHYPLMAWKNREGGDKSHTNGVHFAKEGRTRAIRSFVKERLTPDILRYLQEYALFPEGHLERSEAAHAESLAVLSRMHDIPVHESAERARIYQEEFLGSPAYRSIKAAMDLWCACWFWPTEILESAPLPTSFMSPTKETLDISARIARILRFFHWELEYPDVFRNQDSGFDAILGNPPWDTLQPNSKEYFSNIDPLYRSYGKQQALAYQKQYFKEQDLERSWLEYNSLFSDYSNWVKYVYSPFGDLNSGKSSVGSFRIVRGKDNDIIHTRWRNARLKSRGYVECEHPFLYRGQGKAYTYKLFLELAYSLIRKNSRLGFIVPSGIYSDHGTNELRRLFLDRCRWEWLFGFENREKIFEIDSRFKFNPIIIEKGGKTDSISTAFMRRRLEDWERGEEIATQYSRAQVEKFSPKSLAILEIQSKRDLEILEKIYSNSVLLGDEGPNGWGIKYAQGDFNMTSDSKLFPPRPWWEERGYRPDEYSRWLKGEWRPIGELWAELGIDPTKVRPVEVELADWLFDASAGPEERQARAQFVHGHYLKPGDVQRTNWRLRCAQPPYDSLPIPRAEIPAGFVLSRDADAWIEETAIKDVALPLYQGVMIKIGRPSAARCISTGRGKNDWQFNDHNSTSVTPKFLITTKDKLGLPKIVFRDIARSTDERTIISAILPGYPCGNILGTLSSNLPLEGMAGSLFTLACDWQMRQRIVGTHLNWFVMQELAVIRNSPSDSVIRKLTMHLNAVGPQAAPWVIREKISSRYSESNWKRAWALTSAEAQRKLLQLEAIVCSLYGLKIEDVRHMLDESMSNPKGFWRVDKDKSPEIRHTTLSIVSFVDLENEIKKQGDNMDAGIEAFDKQNQGDGWVLPEQVKMSDYQLLVDKRTDSILPIASRLGPRYFDWQLSQTSEESWKECCLHARNLLGPAEYENVIMGTMKSYYTAEEESSSERSIREGPAGTLFKGHKGQD